MKSTLEIGFIRNYTVEPIGNALREAALQLGMTTNLRFGAYDNLGMEIAMLSSCKTRPSYVVVSVDLDFFCSGFFSSNWDRDQVVSEFNMLLSAIDSIPGESFVLISNFIPNFEITMPHAPGDPILGKDFVVQELNTILRDFVAQRTNRCGLLDFQRIASRLGEAATKDRRFGLMAKSPFKQEFATAAAEEILRFLKCKLMPPKKVLILDCDNTLWGGIIGEAGIDHIDLDSYEYPGIAYYRFQSEVLSIAEKGFLICICSKNDEDQVWDVFDSHPHCLIQRKHIVAHRVNWIDKATNIRDLATELNLGLDSMVFVDDNPVECELVRSQLPEVAVIQVPSKIYDYPGILERSRLFDRISVTDDDKARGHFYLAENQRREMKTTHATVEEFLSDLKMKAVVRELEPRDLARAAQLCQRTNQFNLTSRRYTHSELSGFSQSTDTRIFVLEAEDRFGPMGTSGLIIYKKSGDTIEIDTFLLSCRIIGRSFDKAFFRRSLDLLANTWHYRNIRGVFIPTSKNSVVASLWQDYGFEATHSEESQEFSCPTNTLDLQIPEFIEIEYKT
ncbi:MAG: HAD-IIIC family phosphatase [Luteolibacter sp.]|jgi:FkbH-like protein|nr:HAD-IIIC family phosphatase [Luteolibacter sp.]